MRDQVEQLKRLGASAATLNSMSTAADAAVIWREIEAGALRLLFVSPERMATDGFAERMARAGVTRWRSTRRIASANGGMISAPNTACSLRCATGLAASR